MREKIILGGYEHWIEYHADLCCIKLFGFETATCPLVIDVLGSDGNLYVTDSILTEQEKKELNNYVNNLVVTN